MGTRFFLVLTAMALIAGLVWPMGAAQAQSAGASASGQLNVGVVDMSLLLKDYKKREAKYKELQAQVDQLQVDIDKMSSSIEAQKKKYEDNRSTMSEDERMALKNQIEEEFEKYQAELKKRQRMVDNNEEMVLMEVIGDIEKAIAQVAEQKNYHLVLNSAKGPRSAVLYYSSTIDITSAVLETLNK